MKQLFFLFLSGLFFTLTVGSGQLPPDKDYIRSGADGHLYLDQERIRFWGAIGTVPAGSYEDNEEMVSRLKLLGFNMVRCFTPPGEYQKGDGSKADLFDHFLWTCKKNGIRIWYAGMNKIPDASTGDVKIIQDTKSEKAWMQAIDQLSRRVPECWAWDERMREFRLREKVKVLNHFNQYTGFRYADDPLFAVFELSNEEWWFHRMKRGQFLTLPDYFVENLQEKWNAYLSRKYLNNENLTKAWVGNLLEGENLSRKNILLLPLIGNITDEQASSLGVAMESGSVEADYSTDSFNGKRGADVIEFLLEIWLNYKKAEAKAIKESGKAARLVPLVWDTGIGFDLQTQFMQQHADAVVHDSYWNGSFHTDPDHKRFPWVSQLEELPKVGWDDPWLEHNKMEGKPFFVYETQIMQPAKYRAEYPMEIVKLASIQDWDIINWHYWGHPVSSSEIKPYERRLDYVTRAHYTQGYHYQFDEVQQSAMSAAAEIFRNFHLEPAPNPTLVKIGKRSLYSWDMNDYGQMGRIFLPTVYRYGMRLHIDTSYVENQIIGPYIRGRGIYESCPIRSTSQISHDWQKGNLVFDSPGLNMFTGFAAEVDNKHKFANGIKISNIRVSNPENMPYPVSPEENYIEFCMVTKDGLSISESSQALISLVSTSFNSGFAIDEEAHANRKFTTTREWMWNVNHIQPGEAPVLVSRVSAKVEGSALKGMRYRFLDWHFKELKAGEIGDEGLSIPSDMPIFLIELNR